MSEANEEWVEPTGDDSDLRRFGWDASDLLAIGMEPDEPEKSADGDGDLVIVLKKKDADLIAPEFRDLLNKSLGRKIARSAIKAAHKAQADRLEANTAVAMRRYFYGVTGSTRKRLFSEPWEPDPANAKAQAKELMDKAFAADHWEEQLYVTSAEPLADAFIEGAVAETALSTAAKRRKMTAGYNPDQPRDERGRFGSGGGGGESFGEGVIQINDASALRDVFGESMTPDKMAMIAGALPGATNIEMRVAEKNRVVVHIEHPDYNASRIVYQDYISNEYLEATTTGKGIGTEVFASQVEAASSSGFESIQTMAAGHAGDDMNGYYTWPRLGYDADLTGEERELVAGLNNSNPRRVSDVMSSEQGRNWWKENGTGRSMTFDLTPGSKSRKVLDAYVTAKRASRKSAGAVGGGRSDPGRDLGRAEVKDFEDHFDQLGDIDDFDFPRELPAWLRETAQDYILDTFQQPYWQRINQNTRDDIELTLYRAIEDGLSIRDIAKEIQRNNGAQYSRARATNVARTETGAAMNSGHKEGIRQAYADTGLEAAKEWLSVMGSTTRPDHADADGQLVPVDEDFTVGGERCQFPGDARLSAAQRCQCQCTIISGFIGEGVYDDEEPTE